MTFSGLCACGLVKFRLTSAPMFIHCCHCTDCQRQTGSAFVLNALIETDRVQIIEGDTRSFPQPTDSGRPHVIHRCPDLLAAPHLFGLPLPTFSACGSSDKPL